MTVFCRDVTPLSVAACRNVCVCVCVCVFWVVGVGAFEVHSGKDEFQPDSKMLRWWILVLRWLKVVCLTLGGIRLFLHTAVVWTWRDYAHWRVNRDCKGYICKLRVKQDQGVVNWQLAWNCRGIQCKVTGQGAVAVLTISWVCLVNQNLMKCHRWCVHWFLPQVSREVSLFSQVLW